MDRIRYLHVDHTQARSSMEVRFPSIRSDQVVRIRTFPRVSGPGSSRGRDLRKSFKSSRMRIAIRSLSAHVWRARDRCHSVCRARIYSARVEKVQSESESVSNGPALANSSACPHISPALCRDPTPPETGPPKAPKGRQIHSLGRQPQGTRGSLEASPGGATDCGCSVSCSL